MPLTEPVHFAVLPGDGPCPRVLRQLFGLGAEPPEDLRSDQNPELTLLLCPFHASSAAGRAVMYSKGARFSATYLFPEQCASLAEILNVLTSRPSEEHEIFQLVHRKSYLNLIHELKKLFYYRNNSSSWFAVNPVEEHEKWVERLHRRLECLKAYIAEMESLIGSDYEVDCIQGILGPFVSGIAEWFGSCDLNCHPRELGDQFFEKLGPEATAFQKYLVRAENDSSSFNRESLQAYSNLQSALMISS